MSYNIKDKTVLITGANRGIGKIFVDAFIESGVAKVYAAVRRVETARPLVEQYGDRVVPVYVDLTDSSSIVALAKEATDVQVVINNAGAFKGTDPLSEDAIGALDFEIEINVYGLIRMAQAFSPVLKANGGGVFIQLNSVASIKCFANFATYSASKAAAYSITQALREVLAEQGTTVLSVHPGPIATDMGDEAGLTEIAEPPSLVAASIIKALGTDEFHVFPGTMAEQIGGAYASFAKNVIEAHLTEG